jgi:tape measure domain-containing protein
MAVDLIALGYRIDTAPIKSANAELDKLGKTTKAVSKDTSDATRENDKLTGSLKALAGAYIGLAGATKLAALADQYTKLTAQLSLATRSQAEFNQAFSNVQNIAKLAQSGLSETATLYARVSNATRELGANQATVAAITESVSLGLKVSGASATESASAMLQLSQAFGSGVLRGEEFNAVNEAAPRLMKALADGMGVPIGALRELASDGKITSDILGNSLVKALEDLRQEAAQTQTISGAFVELKNEVLLTAGQLDKATGASKAFAQSIKDLAGSGLIKTVFETIAVLGANIAYVFKQVGNEIGGIAAQIALLFQGDFQGAKFIGEQMKKDAIQARKEIDALSASILNPAVKDAPMVGEIVTLEKASVNATRSVKELAAAKKAMDEDELRRSQLLNSVTREYEEKTAKFYNLLAKTKKEDLEAEIKLKDAAYKKELEQVDKLQDIANKNYKEAQEVFKKAEEEKLKEFEKTVDGINQVFREGFANMVNGGKGTWKSFTKSLLTTFKTTVADQIYKMLAQPFVVRLVASVMGIGASGGASAAGGLVDAATGGSSGGGMGFGSLLSTGKSLFNMMQNGNAAIVGGIESLGSIIANGNGGIADAIGGFVGQNAGAIAQGFSYFGAVLALSQKKYATAVGTAIGSIWGPIGAAVGGFLGGIVDSFIGGGVPKRNWAQVESNYKGGKFTPGAEFAKRDGGGVIKPLTDVNEAFSKQLGSFLGQMGIADDIFTRSSFSTRPGKKTKAAFEGSVNGQGFTSGALSFGKKDTAAWQRYVNLVFGDVMVRAIKASSLSDSLKSLFDGFSAKEEVMALMNATIQLNNAQKELTSRFGITVDQSAQAAKATGLVGQALIDYVNKLTASAAAFTTVGDALVRARTNLEDAYGGSLPATLKAYDEALKGIDKTTQAGIEMFVEMFALRDQFTQFTQAIDGLKGNVRGALFSMVGDAEKQAMMNADLAKLFSDLGRDVPGSIQELIALGKSIDYTTAEGLSLAAVFPTLVNAFNQTQTAVDGLINSLRDTSSFKTLLDYTVYTGVARNYGNTFANGYMGNLPSYDVGTSFVPNDGPAMLHQGEAVLTRGENASLRESNAQLVSEIRSLNSKVDRLVYSMDKTASSTKRTADIMVNITPNGDALQTEAAA